METIYHKETCPICNKTLAYIPVSVFERYLCANQCYALEMYGANLDQNIRRLHIFNHVYEIREKETHLYSKIVKDIDYWKEKDRYLVKILEGDKEIHEFEFFY